MQARTVFLCRLLGAYCVLVGLAMLLRGEDTARTVALLLRDAPLSYCLGVFTLLGGLAVVIAHNVWRGPARAVVVTLCGWIAVLKGLLFLLLPPPLEVSWLYEQLHYEQLYRVYALVALGLGAYLLAGVLRGAGR
jgi:hypothetical protein